MASSETKTSTSLIKDSTDEAFSKDVLVESKTQPVLVDFWAPWCGPCRTLTPLLEKSVQAAKGKVKLVKINIDENQTMAERMGVQSIPAVFAFQNEQPVNGFAGVIPESQIQDMIKELTQKKV